jgi:hypothetical protein
VDRLADGKVIAKQAGSLLLSSVKHEILRIGQMVGHETIGECRVTLFDCNKNRLMEL